MAEYIEREAVCSDCKNQKVCVDKSLCPVGRAPAADVEPVKHGRWIERTTTKGQVFCSECLTIQKVSDSNYRTRRCPNCGAKMYKEKVL